MIRKHAMTLLVGLFIAGQVFAQNGHVIQGRILDENNDPLPGVAITLPGTDIGTVTDSNGNFSITLKQQVQTKEVRVTYIGMKTAMVPISKLNKPSSLIIMVEDAQVLGDVIVTGYQTVSKERATGAFGTMNSKELEKKLSSNLTNVLEGQIAGMVLDKDGGISIRGISTLNAEIKPLVVVDGYPTECELSELNPDNIENITVLKDGVAASIYGSRSANGVIVVTTKSGRDGKMRLSYRGSFKFTPKPNLKDLHMASTSDYIDAELGLYNLSPSDYVLSDKSNNQSEIEYLLIQRDAGLMSESDFNGRVAALRKNNLLNDMEKYMFRTAFTQTHNVGINGGNQNNRYNLAVNYSKDKGAYINTCSDRLLVDLKNEWTPYKFMTIGISASINYNRSTSPGNSWQSYTDFTSYLKPYTTLKNSDGSLTDIRTNSYAIEQLYGQYAGMKDTSFNPIADVYDDYVKNSSFSARFNGYLRFNIWDGLTAEVGGNWLRGNSVQKSISESDSYRMRIAFNNSTSIKNPSSRYIPEGDMINETRTNNESWTVRTQINYNKEFGKHRVSALAGNEVRRVTFDNNTYETRLGYNADAGAFTPVNMKDMKAGVYNSDMVVGNFLQYDLKYGGYALRDNRFVSWYFNGAYEYDNRYLISGSVREDLTNFFGTNDKYRHKPLWSVGGTWKVSNESFFDIDWIDRFNIRASYGINGNISLSEGPYLILAAGSFDSTTGGVSNSISSYPNNSLRWEKTKTTNIGIDFDVLKNRLGISLDYYMKKSSDLLAKDAMDPTTGTSSMTKNVGAIDNHGIEISLHGTPMKSRNFQWDMVYNLSLNKNEVKEYNVSRKYATSWAWNQAIHAKGHPMYGLFGYHFAGLNDEGVVQVYNSKGEAILAQNATVDDIVYLGTSVPKTDMSLTNNFTYRNWDLSFMFIAKLGHKFRKDVFQGSNINNRHVGERWQKPGDEKSLVYPVLKSWNSDMFYFPFCDVNTGDASYMKLRDITLTYNFDKSLVRQIGMSDARIYLQARNLFRITAKGTDIDPEAFETNYSGGMGAATNTGYATLPLNPEFYVGLSFSF